MTWSSWTVVLLHHRDIGTIEVLQPSVCSWTYFEQEKQLAEPKVTHPELKSALGYPGRAYKHHVLAIGPPQCLLYKRKRGDAHVTRVFSMPNHMGGVKDDMSRVGVALLKTQGVEQCSVPFNTKKIICIIWSICIICKICNVASWINIFYILVIWNTGER